MLRRKVGVNRISRAILLPMALVMSVMLLAACSAPPETAPEQVESAQATPKTAPEEAGSTQAAPEVVPETTEPTQAAPEAVPTEPAMGSQGGRLVRLFSDPPTLDPHITTDYLAAAVVNEVFGGLVTIDPSIEIVPDLAKQWDISPDGRVFTFRLREDAKFHDGSPVTAEDFRWSLERAADPLTESPVTDLYLGDVVGVSDKLNGKSESITGLRVIDDFTVELTIDAPKSYFVAKLTYPTGFVLDRQNVEVEDDNWIFQPNGTGPFRLERYDVGEAIILARNEHYHLGSPFLDEVEFILSGGDAMLMYENDEIHITGLGLTDLERVQDPANPLSAELATAPPGFSVSFIAMNLDQEPFDDVNVRQALNYAINKQEIATEVLEDLRVPAKGIIPPGFPSYNPDLRGYEFNPDKAKQLLAESKYGGDLENFPSVTISVAGNFGASVGLDLQAMLKTWQDVLGIDAQIQQTEWATFLQDVHRKRFQMFTLAWSADYPDPQNFLDIMFHSQSDNNWMNYNNREVDSLLEAARTEQDQADRFEQYNRIEQLIVDDAPWVPLWHSTESKVLIKPSVKGYHLVPMTIPKLRFVYLDES